MSTVDSFLNTILLSNVPFSACQFLPLFTSQISLLQISDIKLRLGKRPISKSHWEPVHYITTFRQLAVYFTEDTFETYIYVLLYNMNSPFSNVTLSIKILGKMIRKEGFISALAFASSSYTNALHFYLRRTIFSYSLDLKFSNHSPHTEDEI